MGMQDAMNAVGLRPPAKTLYRWIQQQADRAKQEPHKYADWREHTQSIDPMLWQDWINSQEEDEMNEPLRESHQYKKQAVNVLKNMLQ